MENKKYVVCRDDIYVGEVVMTDSIYRHEGDRNFLNTKPGQLTTSCWRSYRSMLFVPNESRLSNDLLYRSPSYPILNVTDDDICLDLKGYNIIIKDACSLAELLEYFGYKKDLTFEDIVKIRKTFFTGRFAKDNCQLFGYKELMAEDVTFYEENNVVTDLCQIEELKKLYRAEQNIGHRYFDKIDDGVLPEEYWHILDQRGDNTLMDAIDFEEKWKAFTPDKQEGPIKKLTRF